LGLIERLTKNADPVYIRGMARKKEEEEEEEEEDT
jgi:hypothetical protein